MYLLPGTLLNGLYEIETVLGHGGFCITYAAYDKIVGGRVAIKEYLPRHLATRSEGKTRVSVFRGEARQHYEYGLKKFKEEVQALRQFDRHPNVVSVRDYFEGNGTAYMVMEYAEGVTLKEYLENKGGRLSFEEARDIMMPVMDALREVHQAGLLHRDISPDNIYITVAAQVKVIDFGAARYYAGEQSKSLSVVLKSGYAPEEQYRSSGKQGAWIDVYAVGATFYKLLTGQTPPDALDSMAADTLEPPSRLGVNISPKAERALIQALEVQAGQRFQTMGEFQQTFLSGTSTTRQSRPGPASLPQPPPEPVYTPASAPSPAPGPVSVQPEALPPPYQQLPGRSANPAAIAAGIVAGVIGLILVVVLMIKVVPTILPFLPDWRPKSEQEEQRKKEEEPSAKAKQQKQEGEKQKAEAQKEKDKKRQEEKRKEKQRQLQDHALMPNEAFTLIFQGYDFIREGKYKNAKKQFALAVQRDRNNPFALNNMAVLKEREGNLTGALADLKNAGSHAHRYLDNVTQTCFAGGESLAAKPLREKVDRSAIALIIQENINKLETKSARQKEERRKKEEERLAEEDRKRQEDAEQQRQRDQERRDEEKRKAKEQEDHRHRNAPLLAGTVFYVTASRLPFRSCPAMECPKIGILERNAEVEKQSQSEEWFRVRIKRDGRLGWVNSRYLSPTPVAGPPQPQMVSPPPPQPHPPAAPRPQQSSHPQPQRVSPAQPDRVIIESLYLDPPNFRDSVSICCKYTVLSGTDQAMPVEIKIGIYEMNNLVQAPFFKRATQKSGSYIYIHNVTFTKNMNPGNFMILAEVKTANAMDAKSIPVWLTRY